MKRVALVTCDAFPKLPADERLLVGSFSKIGIDAVPYVWTNGAEGLAAFDCAVLRSCWDYHLSATTFLTWLDDASRRVHIENSPSLVAWNSHKRYLFDFARADIEIVPTTLIEKGRALDVRTVTDSFCTDSFVVKPAVSASAYRTYVFGQGFLPLEDAQRVFDKMSCDQDVLVQPFMREVLDLSERSLVFCNNHFTHAVQRPALSRGAAGCDSRATLINARDEEIAFARKALALLPKMPSFARVDIIPRYDGGFALAELELIEPALYFALCPSSADRLAEAIVGGQPRGNP